MRRFALGMTLMILGLLYGSVPVSVWANSGWFPSENFTQINPTLPDDKLNFRDDTQESCCAKDYTPSGQPVQGLSSTAPPGVSPAASAPVTSSFERDNPRYQEKGTPMHLVACDEFAQLPALASHGMSGAAGAAGAVRNLPIASYSTNVSMRYGAEYSTDPKMRNTSNFHVQTAGGNSVTRLADVNSYSVCMGRGNNTVMVANTDNGSILTYNGNDRVYLAGHNTNMLTRTGDGEDVIELHQAQPNGLDHLPFPEQTWSAYNIYKTAISGGAGEDTLVIKGTPFGTKWCHIGGYRIFGEYFYVVEFALPPTVTDGPRRQRVNIGQSVEYIVFKGKQYRLRDFLVHGEPMDAIAQSVPVGDPLPYVQVDTSSSRSRAAHFNTRAYEGKGPIMARF